jgi:hypothetical protein
MLTLGGTRQVRLRLVEEYTTTTLPSDAQVETGELVEILREAVTARNGWAYPCPLRSGAVTAPRRSPLTVGVRGLPLHHP